MARVRSDVNWAHAGRHADANRLSSFRRGILAIQRERELGEGTVDGVQIELLMRRVRLGGTRQRVGMDSSQLP